MATNQRGRATRELLLDVVDDLLAERGLDVTVEEIAQTEAARVLPSRDGVENKNRFRRALALPTI